MEHAALWIVVSENEDEPHLPVWGPFASEADASCFALEKAAEAERADDGESFITQFRVRRLTSPKEVAS